MKLVPLKVRRYSPRRLSRAHTQQDPSVHDMYEEKGIRKNYDTTGLKLGTVENHYTNAIEKI